MLHLATITGSMKMLAKEKKRKRILTDIDIIRNPFNATALDIGGSMFFLYWRVDRCVNDRIAKVSSKYASLLFSKDIEL